MADSAESHQQHGGHPAIIAGLLVPQLVCTIFVAARVWSRVGILCKWFVDDTLMIIAWVFSTAVCIVYTIATETPTVWEARSPTTDGAEEIYLYLVRTYLGLIFYQVCLCLTKLSILSFYLRMFHASCPPERRLAAATVVFVVLFGVPLLGMSVLQCHPTTGNFFLGSGTVCFSFPPLLVASASLHTATDAWLIALVAPCVWRLELPARQRVALGIVLSLGVFVMAASLTRLYLSLNNAEYRPGAGGEAGTLTFFVMTILECDVAIVCACAPTLRPLFARLWPRLGMGETGRTAHGRRSMRHRSSADLTSVVSFHGYPWAARTAGSRGGSKSGSRSLLTAAATRPQRQDEPRLPGAVYHTPKTRSLKSLMVVVAPRSRGFASVDHDGEDTAVLLKDEGVILVGCEDGPGRVESIDRETVRKARMWSTSQESFLTGNNDPAGPRWRNPGMMGGPREDSGPDATSPASGFSGTTLAEPTWDRGGNDGESEVEMKIRHSAASGSMDEGEAADGGGRRRLDG